MEFAFQITDRARIKLALDINGMITAILIRSGGHVIYELSWVHEGLVRTGWFIKEELEKEEEE